MTTDLVLVRWAVISGTKRPVAAAQLRTGCRVASHDKRVERQLVIFSPLAFLGFSARNKRQNVAILPSFRLRRSDESRQKPVRTFARFLGYRCAAIGVQPRPPLHQVERANWRDPESLKFASKRRAGVVAFWPIGLRTRRKANRVTARARVVHRPTETVFRRVRRRAPFVNRRRKLFHDGRFVKTYYYGYFALFSLIGEFFFFLHVVTIVSVFSRRSHLRRYNHRRENENRVRHPRYGPSVDGEQGQNNRLERCEGRRHGRQSVYIYANYNCHF